MLVSFPRLTLYLRMKVATYKSSLNLSETRYMITNWCLQRRRLTAKTPFWSKVPLLRANRRSNERDRMTTRVSPYEPGTLLNRLLKILSNNKEYWKQYLQIKMNSNTKRLLNTGCTSNRGTNRIWAQMGPPPISPRQSKNLFLKSSTIIQVSPIAGTTILNR